ncbi:MAG: hypothetical protein WCT35_09905 [Sideroxydans sp.]|jgi:hypothetical protein
MDIDSRFIGTWKDTEGGALRITQDTQSGDGLLFVAWKLYYTLTDANHLIYGHYPNGQPFLFQRVGTGYSTSLIGVWRHEPDSAQKGDQGELMVYLGNGTYVTYLDDESVTYNGTYELSQDTSGKFITTLDYRNRIQTNRDTYTEIDIWGGVTQGTFAFGTEAGTGKVTLTLHPTNAPGTSTVLTRI